MDKPALRASIRERRRSRSPADRTQAAQAIATRAVVFLPDEPGDITCYASLPGEPGTAPLIAVLLERDHRVWLPRITGDRLVWVRVDEATIYRAGPLGIMEPPGLGVDAMDFADVALLPALAVDSTGRRLGQGGGFFDRALAAIAPPEAGGPLLVALVHDDEVIDLIPTEEHDRPVDAVVTPTRTLRTGGTNLFG